MLISARNLLLMMVWFVLMICLVFLLSQEVHFLISETSSLKQHYFLHLPKIKPKLQNYTVVWSDWYNGLIIKKIVGLPGDQISIDRNEKMFINNFPVGKYKTIATDGRALHPLTVQTIPEGQVFLYSPHVKSFDSRYQELGLISIHKLQGLVIPIV